MNRKQRDLKQKEEETNSKDNERPDIPDNLHRITDDEVSEDEEYLTKQWENMA